MKNLLITGARSAGKSTLARHILRLLSGETGGILTFCERSEAENQVFLRSLVEPSLCRRIARIRNKRMEDLDISAFEELGTRILEDALGCRNALIDEIGFLEREAPRFQQAVRNLLDSPVFTILTLRDTDEEPFIRELRARPDARLVRLSTNRKDRDIETRMDAHARSLLREARYDNE